MTSWKTVTTEELVPGGLVLLKNGEWTVLRVVDGAVTVRSAGGTERTGRQAQWKYKEPGKPKEPRKPKEPGRGTKPFPLRIAMEPEDSGYSRFTTVQEYLRATGLPENELERSARAFGSAVMALYRKRHGKGARPYKKLEYVPYLDTLTDELGEVSTPRVAEAGWYASNAYPDADLDLLEAVRAVRHPQLTPLDEVTRRAIETLRDQFDIQVPAEAGTAKSHWLAEEAVRRCLAAGVPCGHTECARRRSRRRAEERERTDRASRYRSLDEDWG